MQTTSIHLINNLIFINKVHYTEVMQVNNNVHIKCKSLG